MCYFDGDQEPGLPSPHHHAASDPLPAPLTPAPIIIETVEDLMPIARELTKIPELRVGHSGFIGYGETKPGDKVLIAADTHYDPWVIEAVSRALRERGAKVDVLILEEEPDREMTETDEVKVIMRTKHWSQQPRRYEGIPWVEELAVKEGYDLLIHGKGGPVPRTSHRYSMMPWMNREIFSAPSTAYPFEVHRLIDEKAWKMIYRDGRGGRVHLADPEGTDVTFTLWEDYYTGPRYGFTERPLWGHLMGHPPPPLLKGADASGVIMGTTAHYNRPFPKIKIHLEQGRVVKIEGGAKYGDAWRQYHEETQNFHYPEFPDKGLFWLWEVAIGTNPKMRRPKDVLKLSVGGTEIERLRSGVIHLGLGTFWRSPAEIWASSLNIPYGHLHVHLLFPTYEITKGGRTIRVIENGHLTSLDDPEVADVAKRYGDPDQLLRVDWVPSIPGINALGSYEEYAKDPASYIGAHG